MRGEERRGDCVRGWRHIPLRTAWLRLTCVLLVASGLLAAAQADATRERLDKAEADAESKLQAAEAELLKRFDNLIELRKRDGKLDEMKTIEAAKEAFEAEGVLPELTAMTKSVGAYRKSRESARKQLLIAYKAAVRDYTKDGHRDEAERVQVELDELAKEQNTDTPQPEQIRPEPGELDPRGRPVNYQPGQVPGVAVWVDEFGIWHLRVSPARRGRVVQGTISVRGGKWVGLASINTGRGKAVDSGRMVNPSTFAFEFRTPKGNEDGVDFRIEGPDAILAFEINTVSGEISAKQILIGQGGANPTDTSFQLSNRFTPRRRR